MPIIEMRGITKRFPPATLALNKVNFSAERREIHGLLGENGAGKTTLMNILFGIYSLDEGEILFDSRRVDIASPRDAIDLGIGMVHQHFLQVQSLTVAENVSLGLSKISPYSPLKSIKPQIQEIAERYGLQIDPDTPVWQLSAGERQRVEIVKALCRDIEVLILDEPTSILTPQETDSLFKALKKMVADGLLIIFITHKLNEVISLSQRITVLRKGNLVKTVQTTATKEQELARMMVGREVLFSIEKASIDPGSAVLEVKNLCAVSDRGLPALNKVSLQVRENEILGVAGVSGNGQKELIEVITGLRKASAGRVTIEGKDVTNQPPQKIAGLGLAHIPEERMKMGLVANLTVADNLMLRSYREPPYSNYLFLNRNYIKKVAEELVAQYGIVTPSIESPAKLLSGGNLQRLILAREFSGRPRLIVASHPTYGLDVGATEQIRSLLLERRRNGSAILLISEDLDEVLTLSDRISVIHGGRIMKTLRVEEADIEEIGLLMTGIDSGE